MSKKSKPRWTVGRIAALSFAAVALVVVQSVLVVAGGWWGWLTATLAMAFALHASLRLPPFGKAVGSFFVCVVGSAFAWSWASATGPNVREGAPGYFFKDVVTRFVYSYWNDVLTRSAFNRYPTALVLVWIALLALLVSALWLQLRKRLPERTTSRTFAYVSLGMLCLALWTGAFEPSVITDFKAHRDPGYDAGIYRATYERMLKGAGYYHAYLEAAKTDTRLQEANAIRHNRFYSFISSPAQMRSPYLFYVWRYLAPWGAMSVFALALLLATALLILAYWSLAERVGSAAILVSFVMMPFVQAGAAWLGVFFPDLWAGMLMTASVLTWLRGHRSIAIALVTAAALCRETALFALGFYLVWMLFEFARAPREKWRGLIAPAVGLLVFWGLFALHSHNATPYIARNVGSASNIIAVFSGSASQTFAQRFLAPASFMSVLWWQAWTPALVFIVAQFFGWGWMLWRDRQALVPVVATTGFWVLLTATVGAVSSYWGYIYMPLVYAGTGALLASLVWYGCSGEQPRLPARPSQGGIAA